MAWGRALYLYRRLGWWEVGGGEGGPEEGGAGEVGLQVREGEGGTPPLAGWQWWDREEWREDGGTVSLHLEASTPCTSVVMGSSSLASMEQEQCLGEYLAVEGVWANGRQVLRRTPSLPCLSLPGVPAAQWWPTSAPCGAVRSLGGQPPHGGEAVSELVAR